MRGLTVIGGLIAVTQAGPIARAAWQAQRADAVVTDLRTERKLSLPAVRAGLESLDRAIAIDPAATRYLARAELLAGAALSRTLAIDARQRDDWMRRARADLVTGLAGAPAHGVDWLRIGVLQLALDGASPIVVAVLFTSIEIAPRLPQTFESRLRVILDCWPLLNDQQKERLRRYVVMTWRQSADRRFFAYVSYSEADYLIISWFLRDVPGAVQEFAALVRRVSKE